MSRKGSQMFDLILWDSCEITSHVPGFETETGRKWCCSNQCLKKYPFTSCFFFFCLGSVDMADFCTILIMIHIRDDDRDTWFVTYTLGNLPQKHKTATQEQNEKDLMLVWMKSPWYFTIYFNLKDCFHSSFTCVFDCSCCCGAEWILLSDWSCVSSCCPRFNLLFPV